VKYIASKQDEIKMYSSGNYFGLNITHIPLEQLKNCSKFKPSKVIFRLSDKVW